MSRMGICILGIILLELFIVFLAGITAWEIFWNDMDFISCCQQVSVLTEYSLEDITLPANAIYETTIICVNIIARAYK